MYYYIHLIKLITFIIILHCKRVALLYHQYPPLGLSWVMHTDRHYTHAYVHMDILYIRICIIKTVHVWIVKDAQNLLCDDLRKPGIIPQELKSIL